MGFIYFILVQCNGMVSLISLNFSSPLLYTANGLIGSYLLYQISMRTSANHWSQPIAFLGKNSAIVLCTHMFAIELFRLLDYKLFGDAMKKLGDLEGVIMGGMIVMLMFPAISFCNRFCPVLFGKTRNRAQ